MAVPGWLTLRRPAPPVTTRPAAESAIAHSRAAIAAHVRAQFAAVAPLGDISVRTGRAAGTGESRDWQRLAWYSRSRVGPVRSGLRWQAEAVGRVRFTLGVHDPATARPVDTDTPDGEQAARAMVGGQLLADARAQLERLPWHDLGWAAAVAENLLVAAEVSMWGHTRVLAGTRRRTVEEWTPLSVFLAQTTPDGRQQVRADDAHPWRDVGDRETLTRLLFASSAFPSRPDGPMAALEDAFQQLVMITMELRALGLSRIAQNGFLIVPDTLSLVPLADDSDRGPIPTGDDDFVAELVTGMSRPIADPGSAGAVAPGVLIGPEEAADKIRHLPIVRAAAEDAIARYDSVLRHVYQSLDLPVEQNEGLGSMKYWNGVVVDADRYRSYVEPKARQVGDAIMRGFVRDQLVTELGHDPAATRRLLLVPHGEHIVANPDRLSDSLKAAQVGAVGLATVRDAGGWSDEDAPTPEDLDIMRSLRGRGPARDSDDPATPPDDVTPPAELAATRAVRALTAAVPDPDNAARDLAALDRDLRARLVTAGDETLDTAVRTAAARLRSRARAHPELRARLDRARPAIHDVGVMIGRPAAAELGIDVAELLAGAFDRLRRSWRDWVTATARDAGRILAPTLDQPKAAIQGRLVLAVELRIDVAWEPVAAELTARADTALYDPLPAPPSAGEDAAPVAAAVTPLPSGLWRAARAQVGGWA
ncbi:MAG: hypothetical protein ACRCZP_20125, partial [Phycicoccus sp.]